MGSMIQSYVYFLVLALYCWAHSTNAFTFIAPTLQHHRICASTTTLSAKKNAAAKKIQVKMLKSVPGTGQKGAVVQVTPAFFQNKLRPTKSAEVISDDEVKREQVEKAAAMEEERQEATELQEIIAQTTIKISRKAGKDGQLFGAISPKIIMEELQTQLDSHRDFLSRKGVKIVSVADENGKKMRSDIKHTGDFQAQISLTKSIACKVIIHVEAE